MATTPQDLGRIKHALLARRTSLRQRHERIRQDLQRRDAPLVADAPDRAVQLQNDGEIEAVRLQMLHAVTCADCTSD